MTPAERSLFESMGKDQLGQKALPEVWAHRAWPTAFVCKRSGKAKAVQSVNNALRKAAQTMGLFVSKGLVETEWSWIAEKEGHRRVYWRSK